METWGSDDQSVFSCFFHQYVFKGLVKLIIFISTEQTHEAIEINRSFGATEWIDRHRFRVKPSLSSYPDNICMVSVVVLGGDCVCFTENTSVYSSESSDGVILSGRGWYSNDTHCTLKEGSFVVLSWRRTMEAQFKPTFHRKCINNSCGSHKIWTNSTYSLVLHFCIFA